MTNSQRLATVRSHLRRWLESNKAPRNADAGAGEGSEATDDAATLNADSGLNDHLAIQQIDDNAEIVSESILIREGFYAGRTFNATARGETYRATWFMEQDELKIHAAGGELVASFQSDEIVLEDQAELQPADPNPISFPMPAAGDAPSTVQENDDEDQISKAA